MERLSRNLRVLLRAQGIVAEIRLHHLVARYGLGLFAGLIGIFGLLMLNLAGYFALEAQLGRVQAAVAVAVGDFVVALVLLAFAARRPHGQELEMAQELQGAALDALLADVRGLESHFKNPLDSMLPSLVVPLASLLMASLKKKATPPSP
jgi:hypothetical protein